MTYDIGVGLAVDPEVACESVDHQITTKCLQKLPSLFILKQVLVTDSKDLCADSFLFFRNILS